MRDLPITDLPIDEKWILIGIAILALAALSHLRKMWREARHGMGDGPKSTNAHPAHRYFAAWEAAGEAVGLESMPTDGDLDAPRLRGRLRGLPAEIDMALQRRGGRAPDPEAINPATVRCRISARVELPFPWRGMTVRKFIRSDSPNQEGSDDVSLPPELLANGQVLSVRLSSRARQGLSTMADDFHDLRVIDGTLRVVDYVHPSRNVYEWKESFDELIRKIQSDAGAFAGGGLTIRFRDPQRGADTEMRLEPEADLPA